MSAPLCLSNVRLDSGEHTVHLRLAVTNRSGQELAAGGVRFIAIDKQGVRHKESVPWLWPIASGETISVVAHLGNGLWDQRTIRLESFAYIEFSGRIQDIAGAVSVGVMGGTKIENES